MEYYVVIEGITPIGVGKTVEEAREVLHKRLAELNSSNLGPTRHSFDRRLRNTLSITRVINPDLQETPVWWVRVDLDKREGGTSYIFEFSDRSSHLTYFPDGCGEIPESCQMAKTHDLVDFFSKASLEDAFLKAEAFLKVRGKSFTRQVVDYKAT